MLNSGYTMPVIGLGTWTLSDDQAETSVYAALKTGMRLIDTARYYGNEAGVGRGVRRTIEDGNVTREKSSSPARSCQAIMTALPGELTILSGIWAWIMST